MSRTRAITSLALVCGLFAPLALFALLVLPGCLSPGNIDNPEEYLAKIGRGDGGSGRADGSVSQGTGSDGGSVNPCDAVVTELLKTCQASVCHGTDSSSPLNLQATGLPDRLVDQKASSACKELPYIDSAAPEKSLILAKLTTKPPCGSPMPLGGKTPTDGQRTCMLEWVTDAAGGNSSGSGSMDAGAGAGMKDAGAGGMDSGAADCKSRDTDMDGTNDCDDMCISDKAKTKPGACGCGKPDDDTDNDGMPDCMDTDVPGLLVGSLDGNPNNTDPNPGNMGVDPLGASKSEATDWPLNTTLVFTGKIQITASGVASFFENIDDGVHLVIDGTTVLDDDVWNVATAGKIERPAGWYDFELRLANGDGDSGPSNGAPIGFGYSPMDRAGSTTPGDYVHPANSSATKGDLFLTPKP